MLKNVLQHSKICVLVFDLCTLNFAMYIAPAILLNFNELCLSYHYFVQVIFLNALWIFISYFKNIYDGFLFTESTVIIRSTLRACSAFLFFTGLFFFILSLESFEKSCTFSLFVLTSCLFVFLLIIERFILLGCRKKIKNTIVNLYNVVLIGSQQVVSKINSLIADSPFIYNVVGAFSWSRTEKTAMKLQPLYKGDYDNFLDFISSNKVHEIYCEYNNSSLSRMQQIQSEADKRMIRLQFLFDYPEVMNMNARIFTGFGKYPMLTLRAEPLQEEYNQIVKRFLDMTVSFLVVLFLMSWLLPGIALLIKIDSKGPVFFRQIRSGKGNRPFVCYKFRSMHINDTADCKQASPNDARLTRMGRFLRRTSLDELPQFFNVLKNDMSVIGPRPHMLVHTEKYKMLLDNYMIRHFIKPGITGWAQVSGFRGETRELAEMEKRIQHDVYYLENWSFFFDLKILFLTIWILLRKNDKAY